MRNKGFIAALVMWGVIMLANIALWGGLVYVAIHFIRKFW